MIKITDLSFSYGEKLVLKNINLTVHDGEKIGIVGQSGSGKSTLIKLISGLYKVQKGSIQVDGKTAVVMQSLNLFPLTIRENITCGHQIDDEKILPWLYTQDSIDEIFNDPASWNKSNPSLGTIKTMSYFNDIMNKARNDMATKVTMLCKDFNIKQIESGSWLTFSELNNEETYKLTDLSDSYAIGGVDLSSTTDLTAAVLLLVKNGKKYVIPHFFMPSELVQKRVEEDKIPYDIWVKKGYVTLTQGNQNDFSLVTQWFLKMVREFDIRPLWIGYDPWNSQYWVKEMEDAGFTMEKIRQGIYTLSEPMKQLEGDLKNKLINYNNHPILKWCFANTQAKVDVNGNIQPSKLNSKLKRIDGCVALIIAYAVMTRYKNDYENMVN